MRSASLVTAAIAVVMATTVALPTLAQAATSNAYEPMPNFIGMGHAGVFSEMYSAQLFFKTIGPGANSSRWVRVVSEIPAAGTMIHPFSTVILQVTTAPAPVALDSVKRTTPVHHVTPVHHATVTKPVSKRHVIVTEAVPKKRSTLKVAVVNRTTVKKPTSTKNKPVHPKVAAFRIGVATWYSYIPGQCASWYLPQGTRINVEDLITHKVISCVVTDREVARGNRVVDLSETQFAELAPLGVGVVPVRVTW